MTQRGNGYASAMPRRVREEIIEDVDPAPVTRRVVTERRVGGSPFGAGNPMALVMAVVLTVFILVLVFGYLL